MVKERVLSILLCLCIAAALLPAVSLPAAAADTVTYIDAEGNPQSASVTPVTSELICGTRAGTMFLARFRYQASL